MRLGVIDVGSNTAHLLVVDAHLGGHPLPAFSHQSDLRLSENITPRGEITQVCADRLVAFVAESLVLAEDQGVEDLFSFATSAVREATNGDEVLARVHADTGVQLGVLPGEEEARMTFLAVRDLPRRAPLVWVVERSAPRRRHRRRLARARFRHR